MSIGNTTFPSNPTSGQAAWDGPLNSILTAITTLLSQLIGTDSLNIQASLDMQGNRVINVLGLTFSETGDPGVPLSAWFGTDGNLYIRDGANRVVQLTSGGAIDVTSAGGFGGDYIAANAAANFTSATNRYSFLVTPSGTVADVETANVRIRKSGGTSNAVILTAPTLGSDITLVFPAALPSSTSVLTCDATGTLNFASTLNNLNVTGTFVVSGTQAYTQKTKMLHPAGGISSAGSPTFQGSNQRWAYGAGPSAVDFQLPFNVGDRILGVTVWHIRSTAVTASLVQNYVDGNTLGKIAAIVSTTGSTWQTMRLANTGSMPYVFSNTGSLILRIEAGSSLDGSSIMSVDYDHPIGK